MARQTAGQERPFSLETFPFLPHHHHHHPPIYNHELVVDFPPCFEKNCSGDFGAVQVRPLLKLRTWPTFPSQAQELGGFGLPERCRCWCWLYLVPAARARLHWSPTTVQQPAPLWVYYTAVSRLSGAEPSTLLITGITSSHC